MTASSRQPADRGLQRRLLTWLQEHPDTAYNRDQLAGTVSSDPTKVASAMNALHRKGEPITVLVAAHRWSYSPTGQPVPASKPGGRLFEELAVTRTGDVLVECEDGKVYRLVEL